MYSYTYLLSEFSLLNETDKPKLADHDAIHKNTKAV